MNIIKKRVVISKKILFVFSAILVMFTNAKAAIITHDISTGDLIIPGTSNDDYKIIGSTTTYKVEVGSGYNGNITLSNTTIGSLAGGAIGTKGNSTTYSPFIVYGKYNCSNYTPVTNVNIILEGDNLIYYCGAGFAALQVDQGAQINISAIDPNDNTSGSLFARANVMEPGVDYNLAGAGIGAPNGNGSYSGTFPYASQGQTKYYWQGLSIPDGNCDVSSNSSRYGRTDSVYTAGGNITISSGKIKAWGGHGAGIGGGYENYYNGIIIITGGIIESRGGFDAAGIGSGCPVGTGVISCYADKSAVIVLPPAEITAYGAGASANGGVGSTQFPELGLTGTKNVTYINDPSKPLISVKTEDSIPNANIYLDLTETPGLVDIFGYVYPQFDLTKVWIGITDNTGYHKFHGQFEQNTTFFTNASSTTPETLGRPYMPVTTTILEDDTIVLPLFEADIRFTDYPSTPLIEGYTSSEAVQNAFCLKMEYNDVHPMTNVSFQLQTNVDFTQLIFLASDSTTIIPAPTTLNNGDTYFIITPIADGKTRGSYSDVILIDGAYNLINIPGYIRRISNQLVVFDDSQNNAYIKVTASPNTFTELYPSNKTVDLTLNISHSGLETPYNAAVVIAKYIITEEKEYSNALAANPLSTWENLNIPTGDGINANTTASFAGKPAGTYYIHWYVVSNIVLAHSLDVTSPPRTYGGFGSYKIIILPEKKATLNNVQDNGLLGNPIPVLFNENIEYEVSATNIRSESGTVIIIDTLPPYLNYVDLSANPSSGFTQVVTLTAPTRQVLKWIINNVASMGTVNIKYQATPASGAVATQPLFINTAWAVISDDDTIQTNSTYHQGAGVAIVTFSAMLHGEVYGGETQAVDFNTTARSGVLVAPDEGYAFTGWSHDEYVSLKGEIIPAQSGIMNYDTLAIYGNVELTANFVRSDEVANENVSDDTVETHNQTSKVWASGQNLYVQVKESGNVIRIYNTEGTLIRQLTAVSEGSTTIQLPHGIYIVTVNGNIGEKVRIE